MAGAEVRPVAERDRDGGINSRSGKGSTGQATRGVISTAQGELLWLGVLLH